MTVVQETTLDLKREFIEILKNITDAPDIYLEAAYYFILSTTLGPFIVIPSTPEKDYMRPNIWILLSGRSAIMRKSTVINFALRVVRKTLKVYYSKTLSMPEEAFEEKIQNMMIEAGSPEGIEQHIVETQDDIKEYIFYSHEFGHIIKMSNSKEYMLGYTSLLSTLYSGEPKGSLLVKGKRRIKPGLYVTAILGIQQLELYMDTSIFRQGLMRRVLLVYAEPEDKTRWLPPLMMKRMEYFSKLDTFAEILADKMIELSRYRPVTARFTPEAQEAMNNYAKTIEELYGKDESAFAYYATGLWIHAMKIATLEAVSLGKIEKDDIVMDMEVVVDKESVSRAISFIEKTIPRAKMAILRTEMPKKKKTVVEADTAIELIYNIIEQAGETGIRARDLLRKTKMLKKELKEYVLQLVEMGKVVAVQEKGRGTIIRFFTEKYIEKATLYGKIISHRTLEMVW